MALLWSHHHVREHIYQSTLKFKISPSSVNGFHFFDIFFSETAKIALSNVAALEELQNMLKSSKFDPNNPENAKLYSAIKVIHTFCNSSIIKLIL